MCLLDLLLGYTVVPFLSFDLKVFLCFLFSFLISFVFNVNLWHDFEIKQLQKKNRPSSMLVISSPEGFFLGHIHLSIRGILFEINVSV